MSFKGGSILIYRYISYLQVTKIELLVVQHVVLKHWLIVILQRAEYQLLLIAWVVLKEVSVVSIVR